MNGRPKVRVREGGKREAATAKVVPAAAPAACVAHTDRLIKRLEEIHPNLTWLKDRK